MIEWEKENLAKGKITAEEATKRFDALGATPEQRGPDTRSEDVKQLDAHFPPAKPEEYLIQWNALDPTPTTKEAQQARDQSTRAWLSAAEFPRDLGNSVVTTIARVHEQTKHMTKDELEMRGYAEFAKLERAYGDTLDDKLRLVDRMVQAIEAKSPGLLRFLKSAGIYDNALTASMLIGQSERWHARRKGR